MIHKKLLSLLVLLMTAASGAWATVYNSGIVYSTDLKVGDIIYDAGLHDKFQLAANRYKENGNVIDVNSSLLLNIGIDADGLLYQKFRPVTADGQDGNAWVVISVSPNAEANDPKALLGGIIYDPNSIYPATDAIAEGKPFAQATFDMPASDATSNYELVRDMGFAVSAVMPVSIRIQQKQQGSGYELVNPEEITPEVKDEIDGASQAVTMNVVTPETAETGEYTLQLQKKVDDEWAPVSPDVLGPGTYRYVVTGANLYDGVCYTNEFRLTEGYPVEVPAHGFVTYYSDEKLTINDAAAGIYTVQQVTGNKAVLSAAINVAPANTPLIIYNTSDEPKTFLLIPTDGDADEVSYAAQFKGTLVDREMPGSSDETDYYVCNGFDFAWVKQAGTLAANRCWMEIANQSQGARYLSIVFGDGTGLNAIGNGQLTNADGDLYDLNGRKVAHGTSSNATLRKGVYIRNGKKVIKK